MTDENESQREGARTDSADGTSGQVKSGDGEAYELAPEDAADEASAKPGNGKPDSAVKRTGEPDAASAPLMDKSAPFVQGFGGIRFTAAVFGVLGVVALVIVGARAGNLGLVQVLIHLGSAVLEIAAVGALGTLAAIAAARCVGTRVAEPELFALRMLAAAAAFELLYATGTPIPVPWRLDDAILGFAGYMTVIWLLFRLSPKETGIVVAWHAALIGLLGLAVFTRQLRKPPVEREAPRPVEPDQGGSEIPPPPHSPD